MGCKRIFPGLIVFSTLTLKAQQTGDPVSLETGSGLPLSFFIWAGLILLVTVYTIRKFRQTFKDGDEE